MIDQWFKGVGAFLLILIDVNYLLTTRFSRLKGNERYEAMWYILSRQKMPGDVIEEFLHRIPQFQTNLQVAYIV